MTGTQNRAGSVRALQRARLRDLPAIALATGRAMAARPFGATIGRVLAVLGWPCWAVVVGVSMPHVWHLDRSAMVTILPPGTAERPRVAALAAAVLAVDVPIAVLVVYWPASRWAIVAGVMVSLVAFALVFAGMYPGRLWAGTKAAHHTSAVHIGWAASLHPGSGILHSTTAHLHAMYPGWPLELVARDTTVAGLYAARWGLTVVTPGKGRMTGLIP